MSKIYLKITLYSFVSLIALGCLFVLFFSPSDSLVKFVPAEATLYLHSKNNFLAKLPENQKNLFLNWLGTKSTLTQTQWQQIIHLKNKEFALFTLNSQFFSLTKNNPTLKTFLVNNKISFTEVNDILYIPAIKITNSAFNQETWYKKIRKHFNFSALNVYIKNPRALDIPTALINTKDLPLVVTNTTIQNTNCYNLRGQIGLNVSEKQDPKLSSTPDTQLYFNNLPTSAIAQKVDYTLNNFPLLLLKTLSGSVEFVYNSDNFVIRASKKQNSLDYIKTNIQFILAQTKPLERTKLLPDETTSIQLIADPTKYQFASVDNKYQQIKINDPNFEINIQETENDYYIFNNYATLNSTQTNTNTRLNPFFNKTKQGILYLNSKEIPNLQNLSAIWFLNKNANNLSICIK